MRKAYWHKLPKDSQEALYAYSGYTYAEFMSKYKQPPWCDYHNALEGKMGCWSLIIPGRVRDADFCVACDCFNPEK